MIRIDNLSKKFGDKQVLQNLTLCLPERGTIAVCGSSGCGKSTLFSLIAGLDKDYEGKISFPAGTKIAVSFQDSRLLPHRTALQNVNLVLGDRKATLEHAAEALFSLGIDEETAQKYPAELSGGMRARVSVARALAYDADVYLFDEPFANLDGETALTTAREISRRTANALTLAVVHDVPLAKRFADTILFFDKTPMSSFTVWQCGCEQL